MIIEGSEPNEGKYKYLTVYTNDISDEELKKDEDALKRRDLDKNARAKFLASAATRNRHIIYSNDPRFEPTTRHIQAANSIGKIGPYVKKKQANATAAHLATGVGTKAGRMKLREDFERDADDDWLDGGVATTGVGTNAGRMKLREDFERDDDEHMSIGSLDDCVVDADGDGGDGGSDLSLMLQVSDGDDDGNEEKTDD